MNVGITIFTAEGANVWNNGLNQNLAFVVQLLRSVPRVNGVFLINGGLGTALPAGLEEPLSDVPFVQPSEVTHNVDVVIEMGAQLPTEWLMRVRALGVKTVLFVVGHTYANVVENSIFGGTGGANLGGGPWDEIWTLPHHERSSGSLLRTVADAPLFVLPHIWEPSFIRRAADVAAAKTGATFGFDPYASPPRKWRVGIFEPNISVVKSCVLPMLACEQAYRLEKESIEVMMVWNSLHLKDHLSFNSVAGSMDLVRDNRASFEPRLTFAEAMTSQELNAVVTHQWECGLNYLYYDALYGGYPLIHNSLYLQKSGVGLYYPHFEATSAAGVLLQSRRQGVDFWMEYRRMAQTFLHGLHPERPDNISAFERRLLHPTSRRGQRVTS